MSGGKLSSKQSVSNVGNAWIVTQSKSHPDHVYYFNTVTGEAVWNLSEAEIEKATQILEQRHGDKLFCPEPMDNPPTVQTSILRKQTCKGYVEHKQTNICKQTGNNMFQAQQSTGSLYTEMPVNNIPGFGLNAINTQLCNTFNVVGTPAVYDPHLSFIERPQQLIFTPTIPLVNQAQATLNIPYNQLLKDRDSGADRHNRFQDSSHRWNRKYKQNSYFNRGGRRNFKYQSKNNSDLRQRLSLRTGLRNSHKPNTFTNTNGASNKNNNDVSAVNASTQGIEGDMNEVQSNASTPVIEEYHNNKESKDSEKSSNIDVTPLKCPEYSDANSNVWYIVTDFNVLLKEFELLNVIMESDEQCKLMIPENVMSQLKNYIASSNNKPARCIYNTLSQLIKKGSACTDEKSGQDNADSIANPVLNTCFKLLEENYHVLLITNDQELLKYKKFVKMSIFTTDEVKSLVKVGVFSNESQRTAISNLSLDVKKAAGSTFEIVLRDDRSIKDGAKIGRSLSESNLGNRENTNLCSREKPKISEVISTLDAAIQTDKIVSASGDKNNSTTARILRSQVRNSEVNDLANPQCDKNKQIEKSIPKFEIISNSNPPAKKREIKLRRNTSNQSQSNPLPRNNVAKSRWRRRQNFKHPASEISKDNDSSMNSTEIIKVNSDTSGCTLNKQTSGTNSKILKYTIHVTEATTEEKNEREKERDVETRLDKKTSRNSPANVIEDKKEYFEAVTDLEINPDNNQVENYNTYLVKINKHGNDAASNSGENTESRESSVICVNMLRENITVEASSTSSSSIISNSESYSEAEDNKYRINQDDIKYSDISEEIRTYPIENGYMEESLKTKCEEWVSRFVQIMEDVLSVVLIREPMFSNTTLPPPWTLHEAAQCIKKYSTSISVKFLADKLSRILFDLSSKEGKINIHMTPTNYMDMYSSGVALIAAIKADITDCDEILMAQNYLEKLLDDIKNDYSDSDVDLSINKEETHSLSNESVGGENTMTIDGNESTKAKFIFISNAKSMTQEPDQQIGNRGVNKSFFSNLNLKNITKKIINKPVNEDCPIEDQINPRVITFSSGYNEPIDDTQLNEPTVVRKFVKCPLLEEKLKNVLTKNINSVGNCKSNIDKSKYDEVTSDLNVTEPLDSYNMMQSDVIKNNRDAIDPVFHVNTFKLIVHMFLKNVKNTLKELKMLCDSCYAELSSPQLEKKERRELLKNAKNGEVHIKNLCVSLERMWDSSTNTPSNDIKNALKKADVDISLIERHLLTNYWNTIEICKFQAELFRRSIQEIIADFNALDMGS